jgi:hypothetical protein
MRHLTVTNEDEEPPGSCPAPAAPATALPSLHVISLTRADSQRVAPNLIISPTSQAFRKRFYPTVTVREWNDWRWPPGADWAVVMGDALICVSTVMALPSFWRPIRCLACTRRTLICLSSVACTVSPTKT